LGGGKHTVDLTSGGAITYAMIEKCFISNATRACIRATGGLENCYFSYNYLTQTNSNTTYASGGYCFLSEDSGGGAVTYFANSVWYENWMAGGRACFYVKNDTVATPQNQWTHNVIYGLRCDHGKLVSMALRGKFNGLRVDRMNTEYNGLSAAAGERIAVFIDNTTSGGFTGAAQDVRFRDCGLAGTDTQIMSRATGCYMLDPNNAISVGNYVGGVIIQSPGMTRIASTTYGADSGVSNLFNL
jgi:hypothetical protein